MQQMSMQLMYQSKFESVKHICCSTGLLQALVLAAKALTLTCPGIDMVVMMAIKVILQC